MTNDNKGVRHRLKKFGCLLIMLTASACTTSAEHHSHPLAAPPSFDAAYTVPDTHYNMNIVPVRSDVLAALDSDPNVPSGFNDTPVNVSAAEGANCNIQDRFDRNALIAYEWGQNTQNRLGLDVDGIGWGGGEIEQVKLQYTFRLQPERPKKMGCRYTSGWQGMVGSGYNEMFMRPENEGAKADFNELRRDFETRWETVWD